MKLRSKIRDLLPNELVDLLGSVCDTKRIPSVQDKMKLIGDLLHTYGIKWGLLGGATNRFVVYAGGYSFKLALDGQGYRDNLIEYSLSEELQPYVTKSYETNGYILVAENVRVFTEADFIMYKQDMLNILRILSDDYLLGDVGYLKKNFTNWGIRDNGDIVILDYAYVHRATESLFTCPVCGEGILTYDHVFDKLMCTNKTVCHAKFTYEEIKTIQGDQIDLDMIEERKNISIALTEDQTYADVKESKKKGRFVIRDGKAVIIVDNDELYYEMKRARDNMIVTKFSTPEAMDALIKVVVASTTSDDLAKETAVQNFNDLLTEEEAELIYELDPDYESERIGRIVDDNNELVVHGPHDNDDQETQKDDDVESDLDDLISFVMKSKGLSDYDVEDSYEDAGTEDQEDLLVTTKLDFSRFKNIQVAESAEDDEDISGTVLIVPGGGVWQSNVAQQETDSLAADSSDEPNSSIGVVLDGVPL